MSKGKPRHPKPKTEAEVHKWFATYFCGCGDVEAAMQTFMEIMQWFERHDHEGGFTSFMVSLDKIKAFEVKHSTGLMILLLYLLNGTGLAEHGGSVYGCWLTGLGQTVKQFLEDNPDYTP